MTFDFNKWHKYHAEKGAARRRAEWQERVDSGKWNKAQLEDVLESYPHDPIRRILCADGFEMSVQASAHTYCSPREHMAWPYSSAEVGFPSEREEDLMPYAEDATDPVGTVYAYVPVVLINDIVERHGGLHESLLNYDMDEVYPQ